MFAKKKLNRADFLFENGWFEEKIKKPGQLQMQQFQISDCQECNIFLFDSSACVYIDECKFCNIYIGACESSIFVRDSHHLTVIGTTQQFRVRDCNNSHFSIFCESQPIIESSYDIQFSCYPQFSYAQLPKQMEETKTNSWNNNWFDVYDFTPKKFNKINFTLKKMSTEQWQNFSHKMKAKANEIGLKLIKCHIPRILGKILDIEALTVFVAYPVPNSSICDTLPILQSRVLNLVMEQQSTLQVNINSKIAKEQILFLKIDRKEAQKWRAKLSDLIIKQVKEMKLLQMYENSVFAPFKDEH